jgi:Replication protein
VRPCSAQLQIQFSKSSSIAGQKFGRLTVIDVYPGRDEYNNLTLKCRCDCGNITIVAKSKLTSGHTRSCGCLKAESSRQKGRDRLIDLTGQRFGKFTVQQRAKNYNGAVYWYCRCDCGNDRAIRGSALKQGASKSCGCTKSRAPKQTMPSSRLERLKIAAETLAPTIPKAYADRMEFCSEWINLRGLVEAFTRREKRLCRIRGCPICEDRINRMRAKEILQTLRKWKLHQPTGGLLVLELHSAPTPIEKLRDCIQMANKGIHRLIQRKAFQPLSYLRVSWVDRQCQRYTYKSRLFIALEPKAFGGRGYVSQQKWQQAWEEILGSIAGATTAKRYKWSDRAEYANQIRHLGGVSLKVAPPSKRSDFMIAIAKQMFYSKSQSPNV